MKDLKQKVLAILTSKGYHEQQLKELNPIIDAIIKATEEARAGYGIKTKTPDEADEDCDFCKHKHNPDSNVCKSCIANIGMGFHYS